MDDKDLNIENNLRDLRKEHKLSQEELADAIGISRQSIISLEQGRSMPSLPLAISLCRFFDSAFEEVFEIEREMDREIDNAFKNSGVSIKVINDPDQKVGSRKENTMVELEPWKPFRDTISLRDAMDRLFEDSFITPAKAGGMPRIDVKDNKNSIIVRAEVPGVAEEDINVEILDNIMTISGERKEDAAFAIGEAGAPASGGMRGKEEEKGYYYKESHTGSFSRSFTLPSEVVAEKAAVDMKNGVLTISIPKIEPKKAQKIQVIKKK